MSSPSLVILKDRVLPLVAAGLLLLLLVWVLLAPAEAQLGNLIKLVYVHGALVWAGLATFSLSGALGLVALVVRSPTWYRGTAAADLAALIVWLLYVLSAMIVTSLAWGQFVAWNEPRVRATGVILLAAVVLWIVTRLVQRPDLTAAANVGMGIVPWVVVSRAEVIRHPADPIGGSSSKAIQLYYLLILLTVAALAATLVAWLWVRLETGVGAEERC